MAVTIKKERIVNNWSSLVENGGGKTTQLYQAMEAGLARANLPDVQWRHDQVNSGLFTKGRDFLIISNSGLSDYRMFLSIRDYGQHLDCSWYLTCQPGIMKRMAAQRALSVFSEQDLSAWVGAVHRTFLNEIRELMRELDQDVTGLNTQGKGYLAVW